MAVLLVILGAYFVPAILSQENASFDVNATNSTNDMYVIHATVYQVGIITNKSDEEIANMTGNQEALTFYHSNGSTADLSGIPAPLMTNVSAQSVVGAAPAPAPGAALPWPALRHLTPDTPRSQKRSVSEENEDRRSRMSGDFPNLAALFRRSVKSNQSGVGPSMKVVKETAFIPMEAGLQSIGLPSLVGLNTNLASVPVPIPNTSIVRYSKVNTLVQSP